MTELFVTKAIVKLPRKNNRQSSLMVDTASDYHNNHHAVVTSSLNPNKSAKPHQQEGKDYLVTDKLYIDGLPSSVIESEIMALVGSCDPIKIHLNRHHDFASGYIQFISKEMADRAYTLLNGVTFRAGIRLQLKINPPSSDYPEPEAYAGILHIKNLPHHINNKSLYELFRPFGPMILCKILVEQGSTFKGTALVQYFNSENGQNAEISMNNKAVQDNIITVFPFVSNIHKTRPTSSSIVTCSGDTIIQQENHTNLTLTSTFNSPLSSSPPPIPTNNIRSDGSNMVDYTNLYIKNLDLNVKSADLFNHFRKFGRIISARVMKNAQTKQSKGFGFVSFSKADEAQKAKQDMNGEYILTKPVIVAFHEPKKPRSPTMDTTATPLLSSSPTTPTNNNNTPQNHSHFSLVDHHQQGRARDSMDHRYSNNLPSTNYNMNNNNCQSQQQQQQQEYPMNHKIIAMERNNSRHSFHQIHIAAPSSLQQQQPTTNNHFNNHYHINTPLKRDLSGSGHQPSLSALASGALINTPPPPPITTTTTYYQQQHQHYQQLQLHQQQLQQVRPTFRRRGSVESVATVMTEASSQTRRHTITKAVVAIEKTETQHVHDVVDMLLTLKKKDLATCLFNKVFLKTKIKQAKDALDIFQEQQQRHKDDEIVASIGNQYVTTINKKEVTPATLPPTTRYSHLLVSHSLPPPPRTSRAIPIVAPPARPSPPPPPAPAPTTRPPPPPATTPQQKTTTTTSTTVQQLLDPMVLNDKVLSEEIDKFLSTLNGLALHEKKQLLGDRLFPLVKSTGVKQAPKITIRLLDSIPLDELAYSMYDKDKLKHQVSQVVSIISTGY